MNNGKLSDFSYLVWNDMVDKVKEILDYGLENGKTSYIWDETFCTYENTRIQPTDKTLTAQKFNSLRLNIDSRESTGIGEVKTGDIVYGSYFTTLTNTINTWIDNL